MGEQAQGAGDDPRTEVLVAEDGGAIVCFRGSIDVTSGPTLRAKLLEVIETTAPPGRVCLDLSAVDFVDSVGLSALVATHEAAKAAGSCFELANVSASCRRVLEITRLDEVLVIRP
jgi:anti-sigma B factor antagonist